MRFDSLMVWDHIQDFFPRALWNEEFTWVASKLSSPHQFYDYRTLLGYIAGRAGQMRIGVGVTEAIRQHPVSIAQAAITLSHLTKRAPIIGIGAGERMNTEPYGMRETKKVGRLEETLQIIRTCFTSDGPFHFDGQHYQMRDAVMDLTPPPGRTPQIWLAAHGPRMLRMTGQYADGWYPELSNPSVYAEKWQTIRQAAIDAGRNPDTITPSNQLFLVISPSEEEALPLLTSPLGKYMSLITPAANWAAVGAEHPLGPDFGGYADVLPESFTREELDDAMQRVPLEVTAQLAVWGTPEQVTARMREFGAAGMRHATVILGSALKSEKAALYSLRAMWKIKRALRKVEGRQALPEAA